MGETFQAFDRLGQSRTEAGRLTVAVGIICSSGTSGLGVKKGVPQRYPYFPQVGFAYLHSQVLLSSRILYPVLSYNLYETILQTNWNKSYVVPMVLGLPCLG